MRAFGLVVAAVLLGEAVRRGLFILMGLIAEGLPWTVRSLAFNFGVAGVSAAIAGGVLALAVGRGRVARAALALTGAALEQVVLRGIDVWGGADLELLPWRRIGVDGLVAFAGLAALVTLGLRRDTLVAGYALFALSRMGSAPPDKLPYFMADALGCFRAFMLLKRWQPGLPRSS